MSALTQQQMRSRDDSSLAEWGVPRLDFYLSQLRPLYNQCLQEAKVGGIPVIRYFSMPWHRPRAVFKPFNWIVKCPHCGAKHDHSAEHQQRQFGTVRPGWGLYFAPCGPFSYFILPVLYGE